MSTDPVAKVLELVAAGRLSAEEAAPILEALEAHGERQRNSWDASSMPGDARARYARLEVVESGRKAVDLRIPLSLGRMAVGSIPGLSREHRAHIEEAITSGLKGPVLNVLDEDGDGVRIVIE